MQAVDQTTPALLISSSILSHYKNQLTSPKRWNGVATRTSACPFSVPSLSGDQ
jgi:hypothetical protein